MRRTNTDDHDIDHAPRRSRGAPVEDPDLTWLFCQSAAEISGIGSSHGILVNLAQTGATMAGAGTRGIPRCVEGISPRRAAAVDRARRMQPRLALLSPEHQRVLELVYGDRLPWVTSLSPDAKTRLGKRAALMPLTRAAARGWAAEAARRTREAEKGNAAKRERLRADAAAWQAKGLLFWLTGPAADADALRDAREEAEAMVAEAWQAWQETREKAPRQKRPPRWTKNSDDHLDDAGNEGDRPSGEYPRFAAPGVPWKQREAG